VPQLRLHFNGQENIQKTAQMGVTVDVDIHCYSISIDLKTKQEKKQERRMEK
jgi:hypothetical protein